MSTTDSFPLPAHPFPKRGDPSWDLALMFPTQGSWSVRDYLALDGGLLIEYSGGFVTVLPMPTVLHQLIVQLLFRLLDSYVRDHSCGEVLLAPIPVQLGDDKYREPDILFVRPEQIKTLHGYPSGADLVMEIVSDGEQSRQRDYVEKRQDYAAAGIVEYWIVDPQSKTITVLSLNGDQYREVGVHAVGATAASVLLPGFEVDVRTVFAAGEKTGG